MSYLGISVPQPKSPGDLARSLSHTTVIRTMICPEKMYHEIAGIVDTWELQDHHSYWSFSKWSLPDMDGLSALHLSYGM